MAYTHLKCTFSVLDAINYAYGAMQEVRASIHVGIGVSRKLLEARIYLKEALEPPHPPRVVCELPVRTYVLTDDTHPGRISRGVKRDNASVVLEGVVMTVRQWMAGNPNQPEVDDVDQFVERVVNFVCAIDAAQLSRTPRRTG